MADYCGVSNSYSFTMTRVDTRLIERAGVQARKITRSLLQAADRFTVSSRLLFVYDLDLLPTKGLNFGMTRVDTPLIRARGIGGEIRASDSNGAT